jgi:hypothetical protein
LGQILKKTGKEQQEALDGFNEKLRNQQQEVSDFSKHKKNLEWLDKFFQHVSDDTDNR